MDQRGLVLLGSARIFLAPGVILDGTGLRDSKSGAVSSLNRLGREIAAELEAGVTLKELTRTISRKYETSESEVGRDLQQFISALHAQQLLSIFQSYVAELVVRVWERKRGRSPYRRFAPTPLAILAGSLRAQLPAVAIGIILAVAIQPLVFLPLLRQGSLPGLREALQAALPFIAYAGLLIGSIALHELIHFWTAKRLGVQLRSVYVGPGRVGVTQLQAGEGRNEVVSAAGPAGTVLLLLALAGLLPQLHLGYPFAGIAPSFLCGAVAIVHLFGLTPLTGDGRQFWKLMVS